MRRGGSWWILKKSKNLLDVHRLAISCESVSTCMDTFLGSGILTNDLYLPYVHMTKDIWFKT